MSISQIAEGTIRNILNISNDLYKSRIVICRTCKLLTKDKFFGEVCNSNLYLNPETNEISNKPKDGFFKGCGCVLASKCRLEGAKCPAGKW